MEIRQLQPGDRDALTRFLRRVPEADRTFFKEDVGDPAVFLPTALPGKRFEGKISRCACVIC